jgi:hypothetical protein
VGVLQSDEFHPSASVNLAVDHDVMVFSNGQLVAYSPWGVEAFDPQSASLGRLGREGLLRSYCGAGSASVLADTAILAWGGQSCEPSGGDIATGIRVELRR